MINHYTKVLCAVEKKYPLLIEFCCNGKMIFLNAGDNQCSVYIKHNDNQQTCYSTGLSTFARDILSFRRLSLEINGSALFHRGNRVQRNPWRFKIQLHGDGWVDRNQHTEGTFSACLSTRIYYVPKKTFSIPLLPIRLTLQIIHHYKHMHICIYTYFFSILK